MYISDELWLEIEPLIPPTKANTAKGGRPQVCRRKVIEGIVWVLSNGARWKDLPPHYPPYQTCHRVFQELTLINFFDALFSRAVELAEKEEKIDISRSYIDGTFVPAKKGAMQSSMDIRALAQP